MLGFITIITYTVVKTRFTFQNLFLIHKYRFI